MIIVLISLDLIVKLNNIFGVNYHFVVRFPIGHVQNEVKDKQILINSLSVTSLGSLFRLKRKMCLIGMNKLMFQKKRCQF